MRFNFRHKKLRDLYEKEKGSERYAEGIVDAFFEVIAIIESAKDERDLYSLKGLRFEKLKGERGKREERSIRLNKATRLILTVDEDEDGHLLNIIGIEPHHYR